MTDNIRLKASKLNRFSEIAIFVWYVVHYIYLLFILYLYQISSNICNRLTSDIGVSKNLNAKI